MTSNVLSIPGLKGEVTTSPYTDGFSVTDYSFNLNVGAGANTFNPLQVTFTSIASTGAGALLADASKGVVLPSLTLYVSNAASKLVETISLTNAVVVEAQQGDGEAAYAFDYASATLQPYTYNSAGNQIAGVPITVSAPSLADFAAPTAVTLPGLDSYSDYLNVPGDPGSVTANGYTGDIEVKSYSFSINNPTGGKTGQSTPLVVDLGNASTLEGVSTLELYAQAGTVIPEVTFDVIKNLKSPDVTYQQIVLTGVTVENFSSTGSATAGDVQVSFDYTGATIKSYAIQSNGVLGSSLLVAIAGTDGTPAPCFGAGTRLLTERGEVAVESLAVGDRLVTASGGLRPVVWIGHRSLDLSRHADPREVRPVRVRAQAFGAGLPQRDLWLSPGHNIAFEGALVPIRALINACSVAQIEQDRVEYWHVELDAHDVIFAEGLPAESYLDTGNRTAFANGGAFVEAHPDFRPRHWAQTCLPLALEGPAVVAARARLAARLEQAGEGVTPDGDAHIRVDGRRIEPIRLSATRLAFALPPGGREIALCSNTFVPAHSLAHSDDPRTLGLCLGMLQIDGAAVALDRPQAEAPGWNDAEFADGHFSHRWTLGETPLPAGAQIVIFDLAGVGHYRRQAEDRALAQVA